MGPHAARRTPREGPMSPRVLVSFPDACEGSAAFARRLSTLLRDRAVDSRIVPLRLVGELDRYDCVVLGCSLKPGQPLGEFESFAEAHAEELERVPAALFVLGPAGVRPDAFEAVRALCAPLSVGRFDPAEPESPEVRRWAAQLAWTLVCAAEPVAEPPWPTATLSGRL